MPLNVSGLFKTNSFNRVVEGSILKHLWGPSSLIFNPLWIDVVLPWGSANVISPPDYVKRAILWTVLTWFEFSKTGLRRAMDRVLTTTPDLHDQDRLYFTLSSNRLTSNFQGWGLRAGEWREGGVRLDALLERLGQALNSNEQFEMGKSFQLSITQVHHAPRRTGKPRRTKPGHQNLKKLNVKKLSVIRIQNDDVLCCARALVTAKAKVDKHPQWNFIRLRTNLQREQALLLHEEAHIPAGPCGYEEPLHPSTTTRSFWSTQTAPTTSKVMGGPSPNNSFCSTRKATMMSSPVSLGFSGPVTCVPTASNPMTTKEVTVVKPKSSVMCMSPKRVCRFPSCLPTRSQSLPKLP